MVVKPSASGYRETASALIEAIERRGLTVFARIDHAAGARAAGLELTDEEVVIFGDAVNGTPLMQSDRRIGLELPLRMLVWSEAGQTFLGYDDPRELLASFDVDDHERTLQQMATLLDTLAGEAAR
jgi:uncharacterized protein (DUF302 family)